MQVCTQDELSDLLLGMRADIQDIIKLQDELIKSIKRQEELEKQLA